MGVWGGWLIFGVDSGGGGVLAATTAVLFILLFFMCEAIAVAGVLGMVGNTLWYVAGCELAGVEAGYGGGSQGGETNTKKEYWFLCSYIFRNRHFHPSIIDNFGETNTVLPFFGQYSRSCCFCLY